MLKTQATPLPLLTRTATVLDPPGLTPPHPRWVHGAMVVPITVIGELEVRKQQMGQLKLLAAVVAY